jgi:hypothetical protein
MSFHAQRGEFGAGRSTTIPPRDAKEPTPARFAIGPIVLEAPGQSLAVLDHEVPPSLLFSMR